MVSNDHQRACALDLPTRKSANPEEWGAMALLGYVSPASLQIMRSTLRQYLQSSTIPLRTLGVKVRGILIESERVRSSDEPPLYKYLALDGLSEIAQSPPRAFVFLSRSTGGIFLNGAVSAPPFVTTHAGNKPISLRPRTMSTPVQGGEANFEMLAPNDHNAYVYVVAAQTISDIGTPRATRLDTPYPVRETCFDPRVDPGKAGQAGSALVQCTCETLQVQPLERWLRRGKCELARGWVAVLDQGDRFHWGTDVYPNVLAQPGVLRIKDVLSSAGETGPEQQPNHEVSAPSHNQIDWNHSVTINKTQTPNPLAEFDEYGTELHKDARVWKVYVDEADKHDTELVNGWNESTDVILIFAALFSAILTAFLIESSKLLQPDSAEHSARTLLFIAQTLSTIANGTQSSEPIPQPLSIAEFSPSHAAIWVNILWYMALALSLATSFITILAKDWCHSFMSGRTGHPYSQMCRRQRKWNMIEEWRMSELLTVLPSLIHVALLLFSVGLCIQLSGTYVAVAIPIFCGTTAAVGFYVWSSVAAFRIDYFPYPTIISRVCRTEVAWRATQAMSVLISRFGSHPVVRNIYQMVLVLAFAGMWMLEMSLYIPILPCFSGLMLLDDLFDWWDTYLARAPPLLQLVAIPLSKTFRYLVLCPLLAAGSGIAKLMEYLDLTRKSVKSRLSGATWGLEWKEFEPKLRARDDAKSDQGDATSLALSWLITTCEVPQSVDIALQSIAGATSRTDRQPLLDCNATLEILRRLASSNLYKGPDARTDMVISLYSRALTQLGSAVRPAPGTDQHGTGNELEGMIWDVHLESQKRVAASIVDGGFDPTSANLNALRIGNTAASNTLKILGKDSQKTKVDLGKMLNSIANRLETHVERSELLHDSAMLSLFNAAALLLPFETELSTSRPLVSLFVRVIEHQFSASMICNPVLINLAFVCTCVSSKSLGPEPQGGPNSRFLLRNVMDRLLECYAAATTIPKIRLMFGLEMMATHPEAFQLASIDSDAQNAMLDQAASTIRALYSSFCARYQAGTEATKSEEDMLRSLRTIGSPLSLVPIKSFPTFVPFLILGPIDHLWQSTRASVHQEWAKLASDSHFPFLTRTLTRLIVQSDFVSHLERSIRNSGTSERFIALGQLWLLFTIYLPPSSELPDEREQLGAQLQRYKHGHPESEWIRQTQIGDQLVLMWISDSIFMQNLRAGAWPARLMECVYQSRNSPLPQDVYDIMQVHNIPDNLRGLSSFTSWRPHSAETETGDTPLPVNGIHATVNDENSSRNNVPAQKIGGAKFADETDNGAVDGHIPSGDYQRATHKVTGSENLAHGSLGGENVIDGKGNPATLEAQGVGETGGRTDYLVVEPRDLGVGADAEPHVSIDVNASEVASK